MSDSSVSTFPILKLKELFEFLEDLKIQMTPQDFNQLTPKLVRDVYMQFIELLSDITWEQLNQPQLKATEYMSFPELHQESIPNLTFFHTL